MAQQNIDFGAFPNDPAADPLRAAFQKIEQNFTELYLTSFSSGVTSISLGAGLTPAGDGQVGDVVIAANIPNVTIQTGNNLRVGVGIASGNSATISSYSTPFKIDLASNISLSNVVANNIRTNSLAVLGNVTTALVPNVSETYNLGSPTNRWKDLYLSNSSIYLGTIPISATSTSVVVPALVSNTNVTVGTTIIKPTTIDIGLTTLSTSGNVLVTPSLSTTTFVSSNITSGNITINTSANINGNANITGTATINNISTSNLVGTRANITGNANINNLSANIFSVGNIVGNLIPNTNVAQDLGSPTRRWRDLYLSGNTITLGEAELSTSGNSLLVPSITSEGNISTGTTTLSPSGTLTLGLASLTSDGGALTTTQLITTQSITINNITINQAPGGALQIDSSLTSTGAITAATSISAASVDSPVITIGEATITSTGGTLVVPSMQVDGVTTIGTLAVTGNLNAGNVAATFIGGQLTNGNQPGITSVGVLEGLTVTGDLSTGNIQVSGNLAATNMTVDGAFTATTISGNVIIPEGGALQAAGNSGEIQFNDGGSATAVPGLSFDKNKNLLSIAGNVSGGNLVSTGALSISAQANIGGPATIGGSLTVNSDGSVTGNLSAGNLTTKSIGATSGSFSGSLNAQSLSISAGITSGSATINGGASITGNATVGNIITSLMNASGATITGNATVGNVSTTVMSAATASVTGNATIGNISTSTLATNDLTSNNLTSTGGATISGNASIGNVGTSGLTTTGLANLASAVVKGAATIEGSLTGNGATFSGNINSGNLTTTLITASGNISAGNLNTSVVSATSISTTSHATIGGNISSGNISTGSAFVSRIIATGNIDATTGKVSALDMFTSGTHSANIIQATTFSTSTLSATGNANISGNANIGNVSTAFIGATTGNFANVTITGTHTVNKFSASSAVINGVVSVTGNMDAGNITTKTVSGEIVSVSGNVSGANLVASGVLSVTGNASVGNLVSKAAIINGEANVTGNHFIGGYANIGGGANIIGNASIGNIGTTQLVTSGLANLASALVTGNTQLNGLLTGAGATFSKDVTTSGKLTAANIDTGNGAINGGVFTATLFTGNGSTLSNLPGANIVGIVGNATNASYAAIANSIAGANVSGKVANSQYSDASKNAEVATLANIASDLNKGSYSNITGVGTLGALTVSGNGSFANVTGSHYGNGFNLTGINALSIVGTISYATSAGTAATVTGNTQSNINAVGILTSLTATGNISTTGGYFVGEGKYIANINGSSVTGTVGYASIANSVDWTNVASRPTKVSSFTNDSGYLTTQYSPPQGISTTSSPQFASLGIGTAASSVSGEIRAANNITAYYSSDSRLKEDIRKIDNALAKVRALNGVYFNWRQSVIDARGGEDGFFVRRGDTGIIAQEIEQVLPEIVATRADGYKAVQYEKMVGLLIEAIKELDDKVESIKKAVESKK